VNLFENHQIALEGKAQADEKAEHTLYVSILKKIATQPSSVR